MQILFAATSAGRIRPRRSVAAGSPRVPHRGADAPLFLGRELEDVVHQELRLILVVALERRRSRPRENPVIIFAPKKPRRHGRTWTDRLGIDNPPFYPIRLQTALGLEEIRRRSRAIMRGIASGVAFQTRSGRTTEEAARHLRFFGCEHRRMIWNVGEGLPRERLEEPYEFAQLILGKRERWHANLQIG